MKKFTRILLLFVAAIALNVVTVAQTATPPAAGDGSSTNPYQIATLDNLYWITQNSTEWSKYYKQTADIDASSTNTWNSGAGFKPIGNYSYPGAEPAFTGNYDGNNKTISDLYIDRDQYFLTVGMFGYNTGTITKLGLIDVDINSEQGDVGALVGWNNGEIIKCYSTGSVSANSDQVGGLVGHLRGGSIENSYSRCDVTGIADVGGLIGLSNSSMGPTTISITNCYSTGLVSGNSGLGGLIGNTDMGSGPTITNCYWDTQTSNQTGSAGGVGKLTTEMKTQGTFTGWDFTNIWKIDGTEVINDGYPYLNTEGPSPNVPVSDWALYFGILLMGIFTFIRFKSRIFA